MTDSFDVDVNIWICQEGFHKYVKLLRGVISNVLSDNAIDVGGRHLFE